VQTYKKQILLYPESGNMAEYDPWLLGAEDWFGGAHRAEGKGLGFEAHPHRGFETITYMITGALRHTDESVGRKGNTAVVTGE
jgi:redox-sensitive bicupin YhaK (pirin superfamily)